MKTLNRFSSFNLIILPFIFVLTYCSKNEGQIGYRTENLKSGWKIQSSEKLAGIDESLVSGDSFDD